MKPRIKHFYDLPSGGRCWACGPSPNRPRDNGGLVIGIGIGDSPAMAYEDYMRNKRAAEMQFSSLVAMRKVR